MNQGLIVGLRTGVSHLIQAATVANRHHDSAGPTRPHHLLPARHNPPTRFLHRPPESRIPSPRACRWTLPTDFSQLHLSTRVIDDILSPGQHFHRIWNSRVMSDDALPRLRKRRRRQSPRSAELPNWRYCPPVIEYPESGASYIY